MRFFLLHTRRRGGLVEGSCAFWMWDELWRRKLAGLCLGLLVALLETSCRGEAIDGACDAQPGALFPENEGWLHESDPANHVYRANPPASGPHYPIWAAWRAHEDVVERGQWVHNLEHGGVVFLLGDTASSSAKDELKAAFDTLSDDPACGHPRALLTRDPRLDDPVAVVAADAVLVPGPLDGGVLPRERIVDFASACRNQAPEDVCQ